MAFTRAGSPLHVALPDVTATDHHTATVAGDLDLADMNENLHGSLTTVGVDDHHNQAHVATHDIAGNDTLQREQMHALIAKWS